MLPEKTISSKILLIFPIFLVLYEIVLYLSNDAYLPALPTITQALNTSTHLAQLTLTFWFLGSASTQLFLGPLSDHIGRRSVLFAGGIIFILSTAGCAVSPSITFLLVCRFIQGATIASMVIAGYATFHDLYSREKAIHLLAIMGSVTVLAPSLGPLFGAMVLKIGTWHWTFGVLAIWATVALIGLRFVMPETINKSEEKTPLKRILTQYQKIITNKSFLLLTITPLLLFSAMIAWIAAGPFLLMDRFHLTATGFGITQAIIFGCFILGLRCVKFAMKQLPIPTILKLGVSLAFIGGSYAFISAWIYREVLWNSVAGMMLIAGGSGLIFPILNRLSIESSDQPMGSRLAIYSLLNCLFGAFGGGLISGFFDGTLFSFGIIIFVCVCSSMLLFLFLPRENEVTST